MINSAPSGPDPGTHSPHERLALVAVWPGCRARCTRAGLPSSARISAVACADDSDDPSRRGDIATSGAGLMIAASASYLRHSGSVSHDCAPYCSDLRPLLL